ncbi:MAG: hypothetical protein ACK506_18690 [Pirellula sp.]
MSTAKKQFVTARELAKAWCVNYETILRRIERGDIEAINIAPKGSPVKRWRIPSSELNRPGMIESQSRVRRKSAS